MNRYKLMHCYICMLIDVNGSVGILYPPISFAMYFFNLDLEMLAEKPKI